MSLPSVKKVFITGAGGGLGKVLVKEYSGMGYQIFATDVDISGLSAFSDLENVIIKKLDVTDSEQVRSIALEYEKDHKGLDILICLAGIYNTYPVTEADPSSFKNIMEVNLLGTAALVQCFLKPLIRSKGRVIVVSSESYKIQAMFQPYMISKAALENYCRVAYQELALKNVHLSVIRPGAIRTPLLSWMESEADPGQYPVFGREFIKCREQSIKMVGKISPPDLIARKIMKASSVKKPKRIYRVKNNFLLTLLSLLPSGMMDRILIRRFRIED